MSGAQAVARKNFASNLPALLAGAGDRATLRFFEYFTVDIRNKEHAGGLCASRCRFLELV